jgi:uncharacterized membrane protein (UPF0127 family)
MNLHEFIPSVSSARTTTERCAVALAIVLLVALSMSFIRGTQANETHPDAQPQLPSLKLLIDGKPMTVEIAATGDQRYMGLSYRRSMPDDAGMLFVYQQEQSLTFTMRNTLIPLSIAFISKNLVINEIHEMDVGPNQLFPARQEAQYALEVNQGWFARNGIKPGTQIVMP